MSTPIPRRKFLQHVASASALVTVASLNPIPSTAKSYRRILGANDRILVGSVGPGGMGSAHLRALVEMKEKSNVEVTAVCDVYAKRRDRAAELTGGKPFDDYRKILEQQDIDYILITTPEHWHHKMIIDSLDAGKHVYTEKPMVHEIKEALDVVKKVKQTGLKLQVGVQGMSDDSYITARKYIEEGVLGKVTMAQIDYSRNGNLWQSDIDPDANPSTNLDWSSWLGPAPKVDWDPKRYFRWRRYWDYSGGVATDLFIHRITRLIKALDLRFPKYVSASGGHYFFTGEEKAEIPDTFNIMLDYPENLTVMLVSAQKNNTPIRHMIRGDKATLLFHRKGFTILPQSREGRALIDKPEEWATTEVDGVINHIKIGAEDITLHHQNLLQAIRENTSLNCDADLGTYGMVACKMGVMSFRKRKYLKWDEARQKVVKA